MELNAISTSRIGHRLREASVTARELWSRVAQVALDVALPTLCVACRAPVTGAGVCAQCWAKLSFIAPPYCERLGIPFVYDPGPGLLSMEAIANPPSYRRARAAVRYDEIARTLVHALKYQDRIDLAPTMGRWMARAGHELVDRADVIVPVPLHWRRGWSRRYNQSGHLAKATAQASGLPLEPWLLKRTRQTAQQIGLSKSERAANVQGAFAVPPEYKSHVHGRRVLLVDDVLTSGSTVDTCARTLLRARAAEVEVLVFARVVEPFGNPI